MKRIALLVLILGLGVFPLFSQIISVPSDQTTIQSAIDVSVDGDTVLVEEGTYFENINFKGKAITVASQFILDGDTAHISKTVIDGSQPIYPDSSFVVLMEYCADTTSVLIGFTLTGGKGLIYEGYPYGGGIHVYGGAKIEHNIITGNILKGSTHPVGGGGIFAASYEGCGSVIIRSNKIFNNHVESSTFSQGGGIAVIEPFSLKLVEKNEIFQNSATCTGNYKANGGGIVIGTWEPWNTTIIIRNNIIRDNEVHCVASHGGGIFLTYPPFTQAYKDKKSEIEIYNNLITGNYCEEFGGGLSFWDQNSYGDKWLSPSPLIYNNTIVGNKSAKGAGIHNFDARILLFNNIIWNDLSSGATEIYNGDLPPYPLDYSKINDGIVEAYYNIIGTPFEADEQVIEANNTYMNPLLDSVSPFKFQVNSPAIGRGIDSLEIDGTWYQAPRIDFLGKDRPGSGDPYVDPGAIESEFNRLLLSTADLASIYMSGTTLIPPFSSKELEYMLRMPENFDYNGLIAIPQDALAEMDLNHATDIFSDNIDDRSTTITVTSSDGSAQKTYKVEFKPLSIDATLSSLSVSQGSLDPEFDPEIHSYHVQLPNGTTEVPTLSYVTSNEMATVEVEDASDLTSTSAGYRTSRVYVTAEDGVTKLTYRVVFQLPTWSKDKENNGVLKLFPNPATDLLTIETDQPNNHLIEIVSMTGQFIYRTEMEGTSKQIDMTPFSKGVYFITVRSDAWVRTEKVVRY